MPQASTGALILTLALLNGWLASRRGRSTLRWFLGSLVLAPFAWLLTLYLVTRPGPAAAVQSNAAWDWMNLAALALGAMVLVFALLNALGGHPAGGAALMGVGS